MTLFLVALIVILQLVDGWSTWQVLRFHRGSEANPAISYLIGKVGLFWALLISKGAAAVLIIGAYYFGLLGSMWGAGIVFLLAAFYAVVIVNNVLILREAK